MAADSGQKNIDIVGTASMNTYDVAPKCRGHSVSQKKEVNPMGNVRRVYVEKKPDFAVKAKELKHEVKHYLGIAADQVRVLIRYDVENVSDATYHQGL